MEDTFGEFRKTLELALAAAKISPAEIKEDRESYSLSVGEYSICRTEQIVETSTGSSVLYKWLVSKEIYYPGVRYYKDGSGEPPSTDVADIEQYDFYGQAIVRMIQEIVSDYVNVALENYALEKEFTSTAISPEQVEI